MSDSRSTPNGRGRVPRKILAVAVVALAGFAVVIAAIEYNAYRGQVAFGQYYLHLAGWSLSTTYAALQGGTLATAALGLWAVLTGRGYLSHRIWTAVFLAAAVAADYLGSRAAGWPTVGSLYVAGFSIAALRTWHAILRLIWRHLHQEYPTLRYPLIRWALNRRETWRAFRLSVLDELSPAAALAAVRGQVAPVVDTAEGGTVDLTKVSKAEAVRTAYAELGSYDAPAALTWLTERGVKVDRSYVYEIGRKLATERRAELHAVTAPAKAAKPAARRGTSEITVREITDDEKVG